MRTTILLIILAATVSAQSRPLAEQVYPGLRPASEWTIAILSPRNLVEQQAAYEMTMEALEKSLESRGVRILTTEQLRPILRRYRIRSTGEISTSDARLLTGADQIDAFLIASIDLFRVGRNPEFGLSIRLVYPKDMTVISAAACSSTGVDYIGLFGVGRIEEIEVLASKVIDKAVKELFEGVSRLFESSETTLPCITRVAVIQFDNVSPYTKAGQIISNWTLAALSRRGYLVIEPGAISEVATEAGNKPVGGIDLPRLNEIATQYGADYIVTGQVDMLRQAQGNSETSVPSCEFGARLLNVESGTIEATYYCDASGSDGHVAFGLGRIHSVGGLLGRQLNKMIDTFRKKDSRLKGIYDDKCN